ncbi:MAG: hypothetical protein AB6733_08575 [Clostridiaceae bacterium]
MGKKVKTILKIVIGIMVIALVVHLTKNFLLTYIIKIHSGGAY